MTLRRCLVLLYQELSAPLRRRLLVVVVALFLGAVAELVTIGAIVPFLSAIFRSGAELPGGSNLLFRASFALIIGGAAAAALRIWILWLVQRYVLALGSELSSRIFRKLIGQPYSHYLLAGSAQALAAPEKLQMLFSGALTPIMQGAVAAVLAIAVAGIMLWLQPLVAGVAFATTGMFYLVVLRGVRRKLASGSQAAAAGATVRMKILQEALRSLRDILLHNSGNTLASAFDQVDFSIRRAQAHANFAAAAPRFVVEGVMIVAIGLVALAVSRQPSQLFAFIPLIGAMTLGAQRLLPLLQQVYTGLTSLLSNKSAFLHTLSLLQLPRVARMSGAPDLSFERELEFLDVSYHFPDRGRPAVENVTFAICKGERVGLTGRTGSGKSTVLDMLMGLLVPQSGRLLVDGVEMTDATRQGWQCKLAHVPQSIYLLDDTIAANIAFGEDPDIGRIRAAAQQAQLTEFVDALPDGFETVVGEAGVRVSGGQRQRIALARALYREPSVLVLDEATSALDQQVEHAVMEQLASSASDMTIIVAAHGAGALKWCDRMITLEQGRITSNRLRER